MNEGLFVGSDQHGQPTILGQSDAQCMKCGGNHFYGVTVSKLAFAVKDAKTGHCEGQVTPVGQAWLCLDCQTPWCAGDQVDDDGNVREFGGKNLITEN